MRYITVTLNFVEGHEAQGIDDAIAQGLNDLSAEIGGQSVELVNVSSVLIREKLCVTVMARPYIPAQQSNLEALLGQSLTINERRAVFAKLSELIGASVNEHGEVASDGEVKHQWGFEEAKAFVGPH